MHSICSQLSYKNDLNIGFNVSDDSCKNYGMFYMSLFIRVFFGSNSISIQLSLLRHPFLVVTSGLFFCFICYLSASNCLRAQELQVVGRRIGSFCNRQTLGRPALERGPKTK